MQQRQVNMCLSAQQRGHISHGKRQGSAQLLQSTDLMATLPSEVTCNLRPYGFIVVSAYQLLTLRVPHGTASRTKFG